MLTRIMVEVDLVLSSRQEELVHFTSSGIILMRISTRVEGL